MGLCAVYLLVFVYGCTPVSATDGVERLDVFHQVLDELAIPSGAVTLPVEKLDDFFDGVLHRFKCEENGSALSGFEAETALGTCSDMLVSRSTVSAVCTLSCRDQSQGGTNGERAVGRGGGVRRGIRSNFWRKSDRVLKVNNLLVVVLIVAVSSFVTLT